MSSRLAPIDWKSIIASGVEKWTDPNFKASRDAIQDPMIVKAKRILNWEIFEWRRPAQVYGKGNYSLFDGIAPGDIKQGHCGDCYFLSCLSSLAEDPKKIQDIFLVKKVNDAGCYAVKVWVDGQPREVVVDDQFPYDPYKEQWAFSRTN
jgi:hypothetical protein